MLDKYLSYYKPIWANSTYESESRRLKTIRPFINGNPLDLLTALEGRASYTVKTTFFRVSHYYQFLIDQELKQGSNPYTKFMKKNRRIFTNAYNRKLPAISFTEAKERINKILDKEVQAKAMQLLLGGLRYAESLTLKDGMVLGKGRKARKAYVPPVTWTKSYSTLRRSLREVGLTPHMLRKICATELYRKNLDTITITKIMGWENFETAKSYIAPIDEEKVSEVMSEL